MLWNPSEHSREENLRWCWLRAVEWGRLPLFLSQLFAPLLLLFVPWYYVVPGFFLLNLMWAGIRYKFINAAMADALASAMILKWPVTVGCAGYLLWQGQIGAGLLALLWLLAAGVLGLVTPVDIGCIQAAMMHQLGLQAEEASEAPPRDPLAAEEDTEPAQEEQPSSAKPFDPKIWDGAPAPESPEFPGWVSDRAWELGNVDQAQALLRAGKSRRKAALYRQQEEA